MALIPIQYLGEDGIKQIGRNIADKIDKSEKGAANGLAELDSSGKVPTSQLPSYVDDVIEGYLYNDKFYKESAYTTEVIGETGKIYVDLSTNKTYRWSGSTFVIISETLALGETSSTAYRGDRGKIAYDHSQADHAPADAEANVQSDWKETDTTSDAYIKNKPVSLPADGGNADTLDGKGANVFMQFLGDYRNGSILDTVLTLDSSAGYIFFGDSCTDTPIDGMYFFGEVRKYSDLCEIIATDTKTGVVYMNRYGGRLWTGWKNIADSCDADTVDGLHSTDFSQIIDFGNPETDTKTAIGILRKSTTYWCSHWTDYPSDLKDGQGMIIAIHYKGSGTVETDNIWTRQIFISPHPNTKIYQRLFYNAVVGDWVNIADGGNAATVNGYTVNANVPEGFSPIGQNTENKTYTYNETTYTGSNTSEVFNDYTNNIAAGTYSHAEGNQTKALESYAHSEGVNTSAIGQGSHAEGGNLEQNRYNEIVFEDPRRVEIYDTATGDFITITVEGSQAFGLNSHAEGCSTLAYGKNSHTEGYHTVASANESHAEGCGCETSGSFAHAEGFETKAIGGNGSHVEGYKTTASGPSSHAEGYYAKAVNYASHASGKYNAAMTTGGSSGNTTGTAFVIGNGTGSSALSNAFSVQYSGIVKAKSTITASTTADYAEFFEWLDGNSDNEDRVGYFVTLDGDKIRIATAADDYILGVVSGEPFVLGNGDCDTWNGMYLHDEFRRTIYEPAPKMVEILDSEGNPTGECEEVEGEFEGTRPKLNPEYDHTKSYISRFDRKEWSPVGMLGVLAVRHDGTAQVNGYVTVNANGIATACEKNAENAYRVIKSNTDSVVEIIFR